MYILSLAVKYPYYCNRIRQSFLKIGSQKDRKIKLKVDALRAYAKQQDDSDMERWLAEMKLRARRRIGEISRELKTIKPKDSGAMAHTGVSSGERTSKKEVLKTAGLSQGVAQRSEKLAEIPEQEFEAVIFDGKKPHTIFRCTGVSRNETNIRGFGKPQINYRQDFY